MDNIPKMRMFFRLQSELEVSLPYTSIEETVLSKSIDVTIPSFLSDDSLIDDGDDDDSLMSIHEINETTLHDDLPEAQNEIADLTDSQAKGLNHFDIFSTDVGR